MASVWHSYQVDRNHEAGHWPATGKCGKRCGTGVIYKHIHNTYINT